ncbi:MAG: carboxypeptidase-like regulatory domain-containing protein [Isosphaeraceae bacterium]
MLIGYVSDERYVALPDVLLEFEDATGGSVEARSRASGSVHANLAPGPYTVTLAKPGFGSKRVRMTVEAGKAYQFRLLSDTLLGYVWPKWVRSGDRAEFRVHAVEPYKLGLWRYGLEPEFLRNLGWFDEHGPRATMQISPDGDYTRTGVAWNHQGYTSPHHHQYLDAPERSGLYYFRAETANGQEFAFPWIVAPAKATCRVTVLASNLTWNAYNSFGGRSNYIHPDRLPATPTVNSRQEIKRYTDPDHRHYDADAYAPLSFDRPEPINHIARSERAQDPIEGRSACHLAPAEWRLLAWLEREAFLYDYYAESQLHSGVLNLDDYQVLILSTHPEYWTRAMFLAVQAWVVERGGRLMYLGGNGINCEVELPDESTLVCKNGNGGLIPEGFESRFHQGGASEASLLGVVFSNAGVMTAAPYQVIDPDHWAFAGTGLNQGDLFGERSLHRRCEGGASGHETDKVSPSSPSNIHILAKGTNPDKGGAELITYETPKGGAVFSAGSITWPSALLVDDAVSTITGNVLRRFLKSDQHK